MRSSAATYGYDWSILRSVVIVGPQYGVAMNIVPIVGLYAAICRKQGRPFGYPGHVSYVQQAVDARLVGRAAVWAATNPAARGQHFNLTNGEVFAWRDMWPAMADTMGIDVGPDAPVSMAELLPASSDLWSRVVARHGLRDLPIEALLGESHHYADRGFGYGLDRQPSPKLVSDVKIRNAGFTDVLDTEEAVCHWLRVLIERRVLPAP